MKVLYILLLSIGLISCQTNKLTTKKDFEILKTTQENWSGKGLLQGTYYKVTLHQITQGEVKFDSIYVGSTWFPAIVEDEYPWVIMASKTKEIPSKPEETLVFGSDAKIDNSKIEIIKPSLGNSEFKGKNVLLYHINGKKRYVELGKFKTF